MSHEIRTPLNGIIGFTDLLKNTSLDTVQKQFLESISLNANSLLSIVDDILDFSQIQEDKLYLERTLSDLKVLIEESVEAVQQEVLKKRLDLLVNVDGNLPKYAYIDNRRLKQVLTNLLSNAVKFTERGKVELAVRFNRLSDKTGILFFSIKDTGIGMSKEQQKYIFTAFSQGDTSTTKKFGGTGLGLIISQRIAQKMGSEIKFESELRKGSTFYFQIEADYENTSEKALIDEVKTPHSQHQHDDHPGGITYEANSKFLIVDDVETSRFLLREYLKDFNKEIRVLEASNGEDAVTIIIKERPDLVLMDLYMPLLDSLKATKMIRDYEKRHQLKRTIIFALTATATKDQEKECFNIGMDAYLTKPLKKLKLYEKIRQFWVPPKKLSVDVSEEWFTSTKDHELATFLLPLKEMLMRNDLFALDFIENHEQILNDLGYTDHVKKIKKKVINLDYKEALKVLNVIIKTSPKRLKKGQPDG